MQIENTNIMEYERSLSFDEKAHIFYALLFAIATLSIHCFIHPFSMDDESLSQKLINQTIVEYITWLYNFWSSRVIVTTALVYSYACNGGVWRFVNSLAYIILAESIIALTFPKNKYRHSYIVYFLMLLFPKDMIANVGWASTTVNYLWPLAAFMPSTIGIKKILLGEKLSKNFIFFSLLLLIFAANQEHVAALTLGINICIIAYRLYMNKNLAKEDAYFISMIIIAIISIIVAFTCPGNSVRLETEIQNDWFPAYSSLNIFNKIELGLLIVGSYFFGISHLNFIILPLLACITIALRKRKQKLFKLSICVDIFILLFGYIGHFIKAPFFIFQNNAFAHYGNLTNSINLQCPDFAVHLEVLVFCALFIYILFASFVLSKTVKNGILNCVILCAGIATALILIFSPLLYVSSTRSYIFLTAAIFIVTCNLFSKEVPAISE